MASSETMTQFYIEPSADGPAQTVDERTPSTTKDVTAESKKIEPSVPARKRHKPSPIQNIIVLIVVLAVCAFMAVRYSYYQNHAETDDAYITGHPHIVSSRITGIVEEVTVDDNDPVKKGQTIVRLDEHDYKVALAKAEAKLAEANRALLAANQTVDTTAKHADAQRYDADGSIASAKAHIATSEAAVIEARESVAAADADVKQADAQLVRAKLDYDRYVPLEARGVVSTHDKDVAVRDYDVARAGKEAAQKRLRAANAKLTETQEAVRAAHAELIQAEGSQQQAKSDESKTAVTQKQSDVAAAHVREAQAEVDDAKLKLYYCNVYAPVAGHIGKRTVEVGHQINPGEQLVTVVEDYVWVVANYKETQIRRMHPGQRVSIKVDGVPDHVFTGVVDSFSPGSGSTFSLIPPDNATGNFTKIVQRVPVKIRFDPESARGFEDKLIVGMSVVADVDLNSKSDESKLAKERQMDNPLAKVLPYFW